MNIKTTLYRVPISEKLAKRFITNSGFNRLEKRKSYLKIAQIGRISRDIFFNGNTWIYELYRTIRT